MKIELRTSWHPGGEVFWWVLKAKNNQVLAASETYANASNARRAARTVARKLKLPLIGLTTAT